MTVAEVKKLLDKEKRTWEEFVEFMLGQTAGINENGEMDFYESDIDRFLKRLPVID